ncbi:hypothetical protein NGA_0684800 [Nannochloropsis gaditana CCMP526]|uniref:uncharacterized protein n=1 Tax=Nannochloropsis gaditana (strain CCMP526) TaxID=1093141 RepID=UPI00029F5272|nr:hypothetical protein NGA_0684800 [Nannochloropsis gaditana CCMP526]EKU23006.1 hypothetical protein NGA_0684800 [Nannochloropsis gaditana CCMP526]|eukprot:XP_005853353.1 hypothetical protein NGA_0684800 [Nannochloropsis gaditana CCMP526]
MNGIQLTPFQLWLHDSLRTMGLDDGTFAPYIQALLMEASEGGVYENGGVEMTLASLCPPEQEPQWKSFCQGLLLYSAQPHLLSASAGHSPPSVASSPANTLSPSPESRVPSSVSATTLNTFSPVSSTSLTASPSLLSSSSRPFLPKRQQSQEHGQQPSSLVGSVTHDHAPGREEDDPFSLDTLSARVASSCLGEDEEEQETVGPPTQFPDARLGPPDPLYPQPAEASRHMHVAPMGEHGRGHLGSLQASPSFHPYYSPMATPYLPGGPSIGPGPFPTHTAP